MSMTRTGAAALALSVSGVAIAALPSYDTYDLAARTNFSGAYNTINGVFFNSATPSLSDSAGVACTTNGGIEGVWYDDGTSLGTGGAQLYTSSGFVTDVSLNESGQIVTEQTASSNDGVVLVDQMGSMPAFGVNLLSGYGSPQISDTGRIGFKGRTGGGDALFGSDLIGQGLSPAIHVAEVGIDSGSPYSFLFTPSMNDNDQIAGKARRGAAGVFGESQPDEIRVWNTDGSSVLIAQDRDGDPMSPFDRFDNSVSLTDSGSVAFVARNADTGDRGVYFSDGTTTVEIATEADADVSEIEFFKPAANDAGLVAFRAFNGAGLRAVFLGDGTDLIQIATEHGLLETDLGTARIDQNVTSSPTFGGGPAINAAGDVAFLAGLTPPDNDQIEWGSGLFIARATVGGPDLDGDGDVDSADLAILLAAWGACSGCPADFDGSGVVDSADLAVLLAAWG